MPHVLRVADCSVLARLKLMAVQIHSQHSSRSPLRECRRRQIDATSYSSECHATCLDLLLLSAFIAGCKKQVATRAARSATRTAGGTADRDSERFAGIDQRRADTSTLSWSSTNATDLDIEPGVGKVAPQGSTPVNPTQSTTYTITATGSGGTATASARVDVGDAPRSAQRRLLRTAERAANSSIRT